MFSSRKPNNSVSKFQEGAVRLTQRDNENNFQTLPNENNEISKHQRNLRLLMTEIFKIKINHAIPILHHLLQFRKTLSI